MICIHPGCDEPVARGRALLGYKHCLEHGESKNFYPVVEVPKSNPIIGKREDLAGAASSHKGQRMVSRAGDREWYQEFTAHARKIEDSVGFQPDPTKSWTQRPILGIRHDVAKAILEAQQTPAGYYVAADERATVEGYRLGYFSSRYTPSRLTLKGLELRGYLCGLVDNCLKLDDVK